jgi:hypothetical protein
MSRQRNEPAPKYVVLVPQHVLEKQWAAKSNKIRKCNKYFLRWAQVGGGTSGGIEGEICQNLTEATMPIPDRKTGKQANNVAGIEHTVRRVRTLMPRTVHADV